jgi:hypothetical protein
VVEHVTFNHGVEGSSPSALTNEIKYLVDVSGQIGLLGFLACTQCVHKPVAYVRASLLDDTDTIRGNCGRRGNRRSFHCPPSSRRDESSPAGMTDSVRIIKHEAVPGCGSFEVRFPDDRPSAYFYWDDIPARRMRLETLDRETALEKAKAAARAAPDESLRRGE